MRQRLGFTALALAVLVVFVVAAQPALAIGIRPAKTNIAFDELRDYHGEIWIVNTDQREFSVDVAVGGELGAYVAVNTTRLSFRSDDGAKPIPFEVHLPEAVPPGISTAEIVVEEQLQSSAQNTVSSKVILKHKIIVMGPYPDKYVTAKLNFHEVENEIEFVSEVDNKGKQDLRSVQTTFYVNDLKQEQRQLVTEEVPLQTGESTLLRSRLEKDFFELGEFEVSAVTTYDDQTVEVLRTLVVGEPRVDVTYFNPYFIAHAINEYSMDLQNSWNKEIKNVYVDVDVKKDGQAIDTFRTKSVDIEGLMVRRIADYLDGRSKGPGKYTFEMMVNFWNVVRMDSRQFQFESEFVPAEEAESLSLPLAGQAGQQASSGFGRWLIAFVVLSIVVLLAGVYVLWKHVHRGNGRDKEGDPSF